MAYKSREERTWIYRGDERSNLDGMSTTGMTWQCEEGYPLVRLRLTHHDVPTLEEDDRVGFCSRRLQLLQGHDKIDVRSYRVGKRALVLGRDG